MASTISNGESGSSVRTKYNAMVGEVNANTAKNSYPSTFSGTAGATVTAGRVVALQSNGKWVHADKATEAGVKGRLAMVSVGGALDATITLVPKGRELSGTYTAGATYYVDASGVITTTIPSTAGEFIRIVGYGNDAGDALVVSPDETYVEVGDGTVPAHTHTEYVTSDTTEGGTGSVAVGNIVSISQAAYDLLTPDADTLYIITS